MEEEDEPLKGPYCKCFWCSHHRWARRARAQYREDGKARCPECGQVLRTKPRRLGGPLFP